MATTIEQASPETIEVCKEILIDAPLDIAFDAVLEELGPGSVIPPEGKPFPMTFEPWPGGRWYRDLGNGAGHLWAHVQVIKPPTLLELCGPLFMSYPAVNHVQYRLAPEGDGTRLILTHRGMGLISPEHREGVGKGWGFKVERIANIARSLKKR